MSFFVVYRIQADFPGAESSDVSIEVFDSEDSFLLALREHIRYLRNRALWNDLDRMYDNQEEEEEYQSYIARIDSRMINSCTDCPPFSEDFLAYDTRISFYITTKNLQEFFDFLCKLFSCSGEEEIKLQSQFFKVDSIEVDINDGKETDSYGEVISQAVDDSEGLVDYCCRLAKSTELPDLYILEQKIYGYTTKNDNAVYLTDAEPVTNADDESLNERLKKREREQASEIEKHRKQFQTFKESFERDKAKKEIADTAEIDKAKTQIYEDDFFKVLEEYLEKKVFLPELMLARRKLTSQTSVHGAKRMMDFLERLPEGGVWPRFIRMFFDPIIASGDEDLMYKLLEHILTRPRCSYKDDSWNLLGTEHNFQKEIALEFAKKLGTERAKEIIQRYIP